MPNFQPGSPEAIAWARSQGQNWMDQGQVASPYPGAQQPLVNGGPPGRNQNQPMVNGGPPGWSAGGQQPNPYILMNNAGGQNLTDPTGGNQWGYGTAPGSSSRGYYEQQTPLGSFAAADWYGFENPFTGLQTAGLGGAGAVPQNQYLDRTTQQASAGANPYFGADNPYTGQAIDQASQDAIRNYQTFVSPAREAAMVRSGSFGNTGQQAMQLEDQRNLQSTLGGIATNARVADLRAQQQMGEGAANRGTQVSLANSGFNAGDLARQTAGGFTNAGMGLDAAKFDATLRANDLGRNSQLAQQAGIFNAGAANQAGLTNASAANQMLAQRRGLDQQQQQFDSNFDFNSWQANNNNMRQGQRDQIDALGQLLGFTNLGLTGANAQQNAPLNYWQQFLSSAGQAGGLGGESTQNLEGNPLLGLLGGWLAGGNLFGG